MLRWLSYIFIVLLLSVRPLYSYAAAPGLHRHVITFAPGIQPLFASPAFYNDTTKTRHIPQNRMDVLDRGTIKEVPKTKRQPKPEKIVAPADTSNKNKPRSKRRPDGVERPPDIIRRNN